MRMRLIGLVAVLGLVGCARMHHFDAPVDRQNDARQIADTTVALVMPNAEQDTARSYCSGVWVAPTRILTAAHCVNDVGDETLFFYSVKADTANAEHVKSRPAMLVAVDASHDLAMLETASGLEHPIAHVAFGVAQGQFVQTMGQSLGLWWSYSNGTVGAIRHWVRPHDELDENPVADAPDMLWVQTTTPVSPGNSGGGLYDEYGDLVGVCHGGATRGQNLNLFVHRDHIAAFLRAHGVTAS